MKLWPAGTATAQSPAQEWRVSFPGGLHKDLGRLDKAAQRSGCRLCWVRTSCPARTRRALGHSGQAVVFPWAEGYYFNKASLETAQQPTYCIFRFIPSRQHGQRKIWSLTPVRGKPHKNCRKNNTKVNPTVGEALIGIRWYVCVHFTLLVNQTTDTDWPGWKTTATSTPGVTT